MCKLWNVGPVPGDVVIRMHVLYLTKNSDRPESAMILGINRAGVRTTVFGDHRSPHIRTLIEAGVTVHDVRWEKKFDRSVLRMIRQSIAADGEEVDIIHAFTHRTVLHMVLASKNTNAKLIGYRGVPGNVSWLSPLSWLRFLNRRIDRIICVTEDIRKHLLDLRFLMFRLAPAKVVTIHKGHDLTWYQAQPADLGQFGIPADALVVCCSARLRRRKGLWDLVEAAASIDPKKNIHVLFLGHDGNASLQQAIAATPHPERFHLAGFRDDAPAIMAAADVCVMPSHYEGLPRAVIEAMAYGVPPLVTNVGGHPELVIDEHSGLLVEPDAPSELAAALERLHDDPALRARLGNSAKQRIATDFANGKTIELTLALYREVLAET